MKILRYNNNPFINKNWKNIRSKLKNIYSKERKKQYFRVNSLEKQEGNILEIWMLNSNISSNKKFCFGKLLLIKKVNLVLNEKVLSNVFNRFCINIWSDLWLKDY